MACERPKAPPPLYGGADRRSPYSFEFWIEAHWKLWMEPPKCPRWPGGFPCEQLELRCGMASLAWRDMASCRAESLGPGRWAREARWLDGTQGLAGSEGRAVHLGLWPEPTRRGRTSGPSCGAFDAAEQSWVVFPHLWTFCHSLCCSGEAQSHAPGE